MTDLSLHCRCGALRGTLRDVSARRVNRLVCYCHDCRAFAQLCGGDALDEAGGTEIWQCALDRVTFEAGIERLTCVRLSPRGLHRWRAACCDAAIANTLATPSFPFGGIVGAVIDAPDRERDAAVGRVRGAVFAASAPARPLHPALGPLGYAAAGRTTLGVVAKARWRGAHRRSPFHRDGHPRAEPVVLDPDRVAQLKARPVPVG